MKKNDVFTFTAPNGVEVTAVVLKSIFQGSCKNTLICYAQNRIFTYIEETGRKNEETDEWLKDYSYGEVIVDYAILPDYDELLAKYNDLKLILECNINNFNNTIFRQNLK